MQHLNNGNGQLKVGVFWKFQFAKAIFNNLFQTCRVQLIYEIIELNDYIIGFSQIYFTISYITSNILKKYYIIFFR